MFRSMLLLQGLLLTGLLSAQEYSEAAELHDPSGSAGDGAVDFSFEDPDFSFVQFRSNLVIRWEYIPGSELFLVWSQDLTTSGDPAEDLLPNLESHLFGSGLARNIFLLKATYRFAF